MVINHFDKAGEMDPFTLCLKPVSSNDPKHPEHYPEDEDDINDPDYFGGIWGRAYGRFNRVGAGDGHPGVNQA